MLKGVENNLMPFIKRVTLEDGYQQNPNNSTQYKQYYNTEPDDGEYSLKITMDFCLKKHFTNSETDSFSSLANSLQLQTTFFENSDELRKFLSLQNNKKDQYIKNLQRNNNNFKSGEKIKIFKSDVFKYTSIISDSSGQKKQIITVPIQVIKQYKKGLSKKNKNPSFLACCYFLTNDTGSIITSSLKIEVIFSDRTKVGSTGYFVIDNKFRHRGQTQTLIKINSSNNRLLINPVTGESLNPNQEIDANTRVNYLFGAPGDIWAGPVHIHPITDESDVNFGKSKIMAGSKHSNGIPHPFLKYVLTRNNKIVDLRGISGFKDMFSYKSGINQHLSQLSSPIYTQQKNSTLLIDDMIKNKGIFSNCKFSIRPISRQQNSSNIKVKDNLVLFFGIDKNELLRETTKIPKLFDSLTKVNPSIVNDLVKQINIVYFEIRRVNKNNGISKILIVGNNDLNFSDLNTTNQLQKNISKGFLLKNKSSEIYLENGTNNIDLYEFTDGEIDAKKDGEEYYYKIKIKFKDPMMGYISNKIFELKKIIYDLDELLLKTSLQVIDPETGNTVRVFDKHQRQINSTFVQQSLEENSNSFLPLNFSFDSDSELPESISEIVAPNSPMLNFISAINSVFSDDSLLAEAQQGPQVTYAIEFANFIRSSLMLSNTTPMLIEKNRSLLALLLDKAEKFFNLYSTESVTKKASGFTTKDYIKSTRNTFNLDKGTLLEYEHSFNESIDLSKTKDHFNWIEESPGANSSGLKTITNDSYKSLIKNENILNYITPTGNEIIENTNLYDYSFLPYSSPSILNFHKTDKSNLYLNHLQTLRKKICDNTAEYSESTLVPELLATFGIRFLNSSSDLKYYLTEQTNYDEKTIPINGKFEDNFGSEFSSLVKAGLKNNLSSLSFGSVHEDETAWAGGNYDDYPSNTASSILNLMTTNVYERRNIDFLHNKKRDLPPNVQLPFAINLFSSDFMIDQQIAQTYISDIMPNLFDSNGVINLEQYFYYSYLLNIFAKVYYLRGFQIKLREAFGGNINRFSATSVNNSFFVKEMDWEPLTSLVLNNIPAGQTIACKVMFCEDEALLNIVDTKIVNMYKDYYNYNKIFLIQRAAPLRRSELDLMAVDSGGPPLVVSTVSHAKETRKLLDKQIKMLNVISKEEERAQMKKDPKETIVNKKLMMSENIKDTTYIKPKSG